MSDLVSQASAADFQARAVMPARELGAYEALWAREGTTFKTSLTSFRAHPDSAPSDFVPEPETKHCARLALGAICNAGIRHFGIRVHGAGDYPETLRDAQHPVELLYFQGNWDLTSTRCVGTRRPPEKGAQRAAVLARRFVEAGFTVVSGLAQGIDTVAHKTAITSCYPVEIVRFTNKVRHVIGWHEVHHRRRQQPAPLYVPFAEGLRHAA
jgi:DNA processing protein